MPLTKKFSHQDVTILQEEAAYEGFFALHRYQLKHRLFAGGWSQNLERECFIRGEAAAVLLYDKAKGSVVLLEQFRVGAMRQEHGPWTLELVAGILEPGESAEALIHREAMEEAGCQINQVIPICDYLPSPGGSTEKLHLFCGLIDSTGVGGIHGLAHEGEDIFAHVVPAQEAYNAIKDGRISNAATIIALQWLQLNKDNL